MYGENSHLHSCRCFFINNKFVGGIVMNQYYVVLRTKEKDELKDVVDALSLDEALAIAKTRYEAEMNGGEKLFAYSAKGPIAFDENNRFVSNTGGNMKIIIKF